MKKKYLKPQLRVMIIYTEEGIGATSSYVTVIGVDANNPVIEDLDLEDRPFENIDF